MYILRLYKSGGAGILLKMWLIGFGRGWKGVFFRRSGKFVPDAPGNPTPATCDSDVVARWQHATHDVVNYNALNPSEPTAAGSTVRIAYDDGDTELWLIHSPYVSAPFVSDPIEGSCQQK